MKWTYPIYRIPFLLKNAIYYNSIEKISCSKIRYLNSAQINAVVLAAAYNT